MCVVCVQGIAHCQQRLLDLSITENEREEAEVKVQVFKGLLKDFAQAAIAKQSAAHSTKQGKLPC